MSMDSPPQIPPQSPPLPPQIPPSLPRTRPTPQQNAKAKNAWAWVLWGSVFAGLAAIVCVVAGFTNFSPEDHFARARRPFAEQMVEESQLSWEMMMQFGFVLGAGALAMFIISWARLRALRKAERAMGF